MRLGKREKEVLGMCDAEGWRAPFGILQGYPSKQINSLAAKGLIETRWGLMTDEERRRSHQDLEPGVDALRYLGAARLTAEGLPIALPLITERNRRDAELAVKVAQWEFDRAWRRVQERVDLADARAELAWEDVQGMVNVIESKQRGDPFPWNAADEDLPF